MPASPRPASYRSSSREQDIWKDLERRQAVEIPYSFFLSQLAIDKPLTLTVIHVFHGAVIVDIENLPGIHFDPEIKPSDIQGASTGCNRRVGGPHIACHFSATC